MTHVLEQSTKEFSINNNQFLSLVVDDDSHDRNVLTGIITAFNDNCKAREFENGLELMQFLSYLPSEAIPKVVFMDLRMPIWDGIRTLKALEADPRYSSMRVYIVSLADTAYETSLALKCGAKEFIIKPTTEAEVAIFTERIEKILNENFSQK